MKELYDFGEQKQKEEKVVSESINENLTESYDFILEYSAWATAAKYGAQLRNNTFAAGTLGGAGAGAIGGAVGGVVNNMTKRADDPTKKGMISSAISGATKGATAGAVLGTTAGLAAKTRFGQATINSMANKAREAAAAGAKSWQKNAAVRKVNDYMRGLEDSTNNLV